MTEREKERAEIVAWLRGVANECLEREVTTDLEQVWKSGKHNGLHNAANKIQNGEHLKREE